MNIDLTTIATVAWRLLKLLWKAAWGLLGIVGLFVTLDTGWPSVADEAKRHSGLVGWFFRLFDALIALFTNNLIGCLTLLVCVAILTHLLVEKARSQSKAEFQSKRKKHASKGKGRKK